HLPRSFADSKASRNQRRKGLSLGQSLLLLGTPTRNASYSDRIADVRAQMGRFKNCCVWSISGESMWAVDSLLK
ncbi:MAG: hypothetical protein ACFFCK_08090, partial [Promethearchaeota archaeon]